MNEREHNISNEEQIKIEKITGELTNELDLPEDIATTFTNNLKYSLATKLSYIPKIVVLGQTGAGKSSLINAIFGEKICETNNKAVGCTRDLKTIILESNGKKIEITDVPGIGESKEWDDEYLPMYKDLLNKADAIIWVLDATSRGYKEDIDFYNNSFKEIIEKGKPFCFALNKIDKIDLNDEEETWDNESRTITQVLIKDIENRKDDITSVFMGINSSDVIAITTKKKFEYYGVSDLFIHILKSLPANKKIIMLEANSFYANKDNFEKETLSSREQANFENLQEEEEKSWSHLIVETIDKLIKEWNELPAEWKDILKKIPVELFNAFKRK